MELIMLMGIPGSGKSTVSGEYARRGYRVHASDAIRERLYGSEETQGKPSEVFDRLIKDVRADLRAGHSCVIDATNLRRRRRHNLLTAVSARASKRICVPVLASPEVCLARNRARQRTVPPERVYDMLCAFEAPYYYEGWDAIQPVFSGEPYAFPREEAAGFGQDNPHHRLTLGEHLDAARDYCVARGFDERIAEAAWYHDVGKLYTKRFRNARGEPTEIAHFYGHESYSAYLYLCEKAARSLQEGTWAETLYIANLINWHMRPLNVWSRTPASQEKDRKLMGETMFADLQKLHQADLGAH